MLIPSLHAHLPCDLSPHLANLHSKLVIQACCHLACTTEGGLVHILNVQLLGSSLMVTEPVSTLSSAGPNVDSSTCLISWHWMVQV